MDKNIYIVERDYLQSVLTKLLDLRPKDQVTIQQLEDGSVRLWKDPNLISARRQEESSIIVRKVNAIGEVIDDDSDDYEIKFVEKEMNE